MKNTYWRAVDTATQAHRGEYRKVVHVPYVVHPLRVAGILAAHGLPEEPLGIAALLHDVVEHGKMRSIDIEDQFGPEVARLVRGVTPPEGAGAWKERKRASIERLKSAEASVLILACADKLDNLISIREDLSRFGQATWGRLGRSPQEQAWYYRSLADLFETNLCGEPGALIAFELSAEVHRVFG